jgi:hypothetical protein
MDEQWGPRMAFARRRYFVLCTPASVLRFSFSEDRASELKSEHWCGAAKRAVVHCAAKSAFLFQFCTTRPRNRNVRRAQIFMCKSLMLLN